MKEKYRGTNSPAARSPFVDAPIAPPSNTVDTKALPPAPLRRFRVTVCVTTKIYRTQIFEAVDADDAHDLCQEELNGFKEDTDGWDDSDEYSVFEDENVDQDIEDAEEVDADGNVISQDGE